MNRNKKFVSYYGPYRKLFALTLLCAMLSALTSLVFPLLVRQVTDDAVLLAPAQALPRIYGIGLKALLLIALNIAFTYVYDYHGHAMGAMMERDMRRALFAHYQKLSYAYFDRHQPGEMLSRLTNDLHMLAEFYHHAPEDLIIYAVKLIGAIWILARIHGPLTLAVCLFIPPVALFSALVGRRMYRATQQSLDAIGDVNARAEENLTGIRTVQAFANEPLEEALFAQRNDRYLRSRKRIYWVESIYYNGMDVLTRLITVTIVVFGGVAIVRAQLALPDLLTFLLYVGYLTEPLTRLTHIIQQYQSGLAGFSRFMDVLETQPDIQAAPDAKPLAVSQGEIRLQDVSFRYTPQDALVLRDISVHIRPGEQVALVGASGVGKTTLCALLARFYDPTSGTIAIDGQDLRQVTLASLRQQIGIVQQDVQLFSGTVLENIRYGRPDATDEAVIEAAKQAGADTFIRALPDGYHAEIGHRGIRLSGGQRQRISIARVFLKDPPILILDEATSALDYRTERAVHEAAGRLSQGRTTLIIAHRLSTIRRADRILVLEEGCITEEGTHEALREAGGAYAEMSALDGRDERI